VAVTVLALFGAFCAALVPGIPSLTSWYAGRLATVTGVPRSQILVAGASLSLRPFMGLILVLIALFSLGSARERLRLVKFSGLLYGGGIVAVDSALVIWHPAALASPLAPAGGLVAVVAGVGVLMVTIFTHRRLPAGVRITTRRPTSNTTALLLPICATAAVVCTAAWSSVRDRLPGGVRLPFNGWLYQDVVFGFVAGLGCLWAVSAFERRNKPARGRRLSVAFLVPAHNEAHAIGECVAALDAAAARYPGPCTLYVVDNASTDGTAEVAAAALAGCQSLAGRVLDCPTPGKSKALNFGLAHITQDVVVRIDGDTLVEPSVLSAVVPWFWDRCVGGVGGCPLPKRCGPRWLYSLRLIELYFAIAFFRVVQSALDGTTVMPGSIAAYRRSLLEELGGFGEGFNGEDSDMTMRIGRLGYRIVTDAGVVVRTECPATLAELREQRQRWTRGRFHMAGRNLSTISMRQGIRGVWMLPYSLFSASRRALMVPLLVCVVVVHTLDPAVLSFGAPFVAARVLVGLQLVSAAAVLVAHKEFRALPFVPLTVLYRLVLAYIAFETLLTLALRSGVPRRSSRTVRAGRRHPLQPPAFLTAGGPT
jgi:cellulose synthase/poly-beta-1,6-N-acetylglucosamine synthase-like glycosyltransferase